MTRKKENFFLICLLLAIGIIIYLVQILIFKKQSDTFFYFLQDIAFLPIYIIVTYFVLEQVLKNKERKEKLKKLNVVISSFYIEVGSSLLCMLCKFDKTIEDTKAYVQLNGTWTAMDFQNAADGIFKKDYIVDSTLNELYTLRDYLKENRSFMLSLFQNPNLLEHDEFTDMLWAVFHLLDELVSRDQLTDLPQADFNHLSLDIKRAYVALIVRWLSYSKHLKSEYPYLFSLEQRKQPFAEKRSVIITG